MRSEPPAPCPAKLFGTHSTKAVPMMCVARPFPLQWFVLGVALGASDARAADASPLLQTPPSVAEKSSARPAMPPRPISDEVARKLAEAAPKFSPAPAAPANPVTPDGEPVERDRPRNGIIRLPRYLVQESRIPVPTERDVLTEKGRLELALKRHPGLRLGAFGPLNNNVWATALLEEEWGIERQQAMFDLLSLLPGKDRPRPIFMGRPPFSTPTAASGPWAGLVVPWERK